MTPATIRDPASIVTNAPDPRLVLETWLVLEVLRYYHIFLQNLHIVSSNNVQAEDDLLNSLARAVHSLKAVVKYQVDCLIKTFQCSLHTKHKHIVQMSVNPNTTKQTLNQSASTIQHLFIALDYLTQNVTI